MVADVRAAVAIAVAVEDLRPGARLRHADRITLADDRREIASHQHRGGIRFRLAKVDQRAVLGVLAIDPFEAVAGEIQFVQGRVVDDQFIEVADHRLNAAVGVEVEQLPFNTPVVVPFVPHAQFAAHEQQLFAGVRPHVRVQQPQVGKFLPHVARHLRQQRPFAVDDFVVRQRQHKVFGERVDQRERQLVLVVTAMDRLLPHVTQGVVHPPHVPLVREPQSAVVQRPRDAGPRRRFFGHRDHAGVTLVDRGVELFEEVDRFQVLASAVLVRHPLARFAAVIQVQHRRDRVDAEPVDVILVQPEQRVGDQEVADLVPAVVEDQRAPVRMFALPSVGVFVQRRAVKLRQAVFVLGEVGRDPIDQHADAVLVKVIDEVHEVVGFAVAAGRGEVTDRLVTPRSGERMLGHRHQFDVREVHPVAVLDQLMRQVAVVQPTVGPVAAFPPRPEVNLVDVHRRVHRVALGPGGQPVAIVPGVRRKVGDDRRGPRRQFGGEPDRIGLVEVTAVG